MADASTAIPDIEDNIGNDSSDGAAMETQSSSKLSTSKRMDHICPNRANKNEARLIEYLEKKRTQYQPRSEDRQASVEAATGIRGSVASDLHTTHIEETRNTNITEEENKQQVAEDIKEGRNVIPGSDSDSCLELREGKLHFSRCNKIADQWHLGSLGHLERREEHDISTWMACKAISTRRLVGGKQGHGCT